jgi:hypothetical protein
MGSAADSNYCERHRGQIHCRSPIKITFEMSSTAPLNNAIHLGAERSSLHSPPPEPLTEEGTCMDVVGATNDLEPTSLQSATDVVSHSSDLGILNEIYNATNISDLGISASWELTASGAVPFLEQVSERCEIAEDSLVLAIGLPLTALSLAHRFQPAITAGMFLEEEANTHNVRTGCVVFCNALNPLT